ncbi:large conductance mechanosensitive channel protein MscL [Ruminococcaceae bacterium OttesenSCG-928-D13]|nr:large conductance mechanosensitive channel protein MscL [Ruminococcaceae bacterium OttesenSCG-928-D13]
MKKFLQEFKDFALRGNVMDLAVGVIIGAAFQTVVTALTDNILSPIIGLFTGANFDSLVLNIPTWSGEISLKYGSFITALINFIIMAFVIFLLVRGMNRLAKIGQKPKPAGEPATMRCPYCLTDIPFGAIRCPHCTAELAGEALEKAKADAKG